MRCRGNAAKVRAFASHTGIIFVGASLRNVKTPTAPIKMDGAASATAVVPRLDTPLASIEARARRALGRGEIPRSAYLTLMGIAAEAALVHQHQTSSDGGPRKQVTPCDTPPTSEPAGATTSPSTTTTPARSRMPSFSHRSNCLNHSGL